MPRYSYSNIEPPHGPSCECNVCRPPKIQQNEMASTTDRIRELERRVNILAGEIEEIRKGARKMGYALWCQPGDHSFDENQKGKRRMTVDEYDYDGEPTGKEITVHVCARHAKDMLAPKKRSLKEIKQAIDEATAIGDDEE